jgi:hypothetical protein
MTLVVLAEPIRHPRRVPGVAWIAPGAGRTSTPAVAGVLAFPRLMGMVLTHPAAILAEVHFTGVVWIRCINKARGVARRFLTSNPSGIAGCPQSAL